MRQQALRPLCSSFIFIPGRRKRTAANVALGDIQKGHHILISSALTEACSIMNSHACSRFDHHFNSVEAIRTQLVPWNQLVCGRGGGALVEACSHMSLFQRSRFALFFQLHSSALTEACSIMNSHANGHFELHFNSVEAIRTQPVPWNQLVCGRGGGVLVEACSHMSSCQRSRFALFFQLHSSALTEACSIVNSHAYGHFELHFNSVEAVRTQPVP